MLYPPPSSLPVNSLLNPMGLKLTEVQSISFTIRYSADRLLSISCNCAQVAIWNGFIAVPSPAPENAPTPRLTIIAQIVTAQSDTNTVVVASQALTTESTRFFMDRPLKEILIVSHCTEHPHRIQIDLLSITLIYCSRFFIS